MDCLCAGRWLTVRHRHCAGCPSRLVRRVAGPPGGRGRHDRGLAGWGTSTFELLTTTTVIMVMILLRSQHRLWGGWCRLRRTVVFVTWRQRARPRGPSNDPVLTRMTTLKHVSYMSGHRTCLLTTEASFTLHELNWWHYFEHVCFNGSVHLAVTSVDKVEFILFIYLFIFLVGEIVSETIIQTGKNQGTTRPLTNTYSGVGELCDLFCCVCARDCNPGPVFQIPGFGIGDFVIPGSRRDYGISPRIWDLQLQSLYCGQCVFSVISIDLLCNDILLDLQWNRVKKIHVGHMVSCYACRSK